VLTAQEKLMFRKLHIIINVAIIVDVFLSLFVSTAKVLIQDLIFLLLGYNFRITLQIQPHDCKATQTYYHEGMPL
jgi:hypothetical protein